MIEIQRQTNNMGMELRIKVVGLGGAGQNALDEVPRRVGARIRRGA